MPRPLSTVFTARQAADELGVSTGHVTHLARKHGIGHKLGARVWCFTPDQLDALRKIREARPANQYYPRKA